MSQPPMARPMLAMVTGVGMTALRSGGGAALPAPLDLAVEALGLALADAQLSVADLDGIIACPPLMGKQQFMFGHAVAQAVRA